MDLLYTERAQRAVGDMCVHMRLRTHTHTHPCDSVTINKVYILVITEVCDHTLASPSLGLHQCAFCPSGGVCVL